VLNVTHVNIVFFRLRRVRHAIRFAHQPVSDVTMSAMDRLIAARSHVVQRLSEDHFEVARLMIAERKTLGQIGGTKGLGHRNTAGKRLRAALDCLAEHYGRRRLL